MKDRPESGRPDVPHSWRTSEDKIGPIAFESLNGSNSTRRDSVEDSICPPYMEIKSRIFSYFI